MRRFRHQPRPVETVGHQSDCEQREQHRRAPGEQPTESATPGNARRDTARQKSSKTLSAMSSNGGWCVASTTAAPASVERTTSDVSHCLPSVSSARSGSVEQQHFVWARCRAEQQQSSALGRGETTGREVGALGQTGVGEQLTKVTEVLTERTGDQLEVLDRIQLGEAVGVVRHHGNLAAERIVPLVGLTPRHRNGPARWRLHAVQAAQQRRLPGAVRSDNSRALTRFDRHVEFVELPLFGEPDAQPTDRDHRTSSITGAKRSRLSSSTVT